jgi:hypothetical protein
MRTHRVIIHTYTTYSYQQYKFNNKQNILTVQLLNLSYMYIIHPPTFEYESGKRWNPKRSAVGPFLGNDLAKPLPPLLADICGTNNT